MVTYYSQHGEDVLLHNMFEGKEKGFFVEVGCIDGRRFSNTLLLEERGWRGLCVEAHSEYIELLRSNRPGSTICHCAVGEKDEDDVIFYANRRGSLSTLDKSREEDFGENFDQYFTGFVEQQVNKRTLDTLFSRHNVSEIDVLSLDIEGYEVQALAGLNLRQYSPKVLVIESESFEHEAKVDSIVLACDYVKALRLGANIFYCVDSSMVERVLGQVFEVELFHTGNPLDKEEDQRVEVSINTKPGLSKAFDKVYSKLARRRVHYTKIYGDFWGNLLSRQNWRAYSRRISNEL